MDQPWPDGGGCRRRNAVKGFHPSSTPSCWRLANADMRDDVQHRRLIAAGQAQEWTLQSRSRCSLAKLSDARLLHLAEALRRFRIYPEKVQH